jgi:glycerate kinase
MYIPHPKPLASAMALRVLIIPDKFKGTLSAQAAADAIAAGWSKSRPADEIQRLPMSDGGDGFGAVLSQLMNAKTQQVKTVDAAHRPITSSWWWDASTKTAIIESANIIGLAQLPKGKFHPFQLDTFGLGKAIMAATEIGARRCLVGIGGSATNDGGFGVALALGWEFLDGDGKKIEQWTGLNRLARVLAPQRVRWFEELLVAVDVQNMLLGPKGCTRIYGPQKGVTPKDYAPSEKCLEQLAQVVTRDLNRNCAKEPGTGAAGGLGYGLRAFVGARLVPGFDLFAKKAELARHIRAADLVITGEGSIDKSTLMGKGVGEIAAHCHKLGIPCIGLAGVVGDPKLVLKRFTQAHGMTPQFTTVTKALSKPAVWLEKLAVRVGKAYAKV